MPLATFWWCFVGLQGSGCVGSAAVAACFRGCAGRGGYCGCCSGVRAGADRRGASSERVLDLIAALTTTD